MAEKYIDLHVHSNYSDGTFSPKELIEYALKKELYAIALTDHDTVMGIKEAKEACEGKNIKLIPGVELSTEYNGKDIHMLGLFIDYTNKEMLDSLEHFNTLRQNRNIKMCELLFNEGIDISMSKLDDAFKGAVLTRAHFARYMLDNGYVKSMDEAFEKYLKEGCPCYVPKVKISPYQAINLIKQANGIPIIAHPMLYHFSYEALEELICNFKEAGLEGIEAIYTLHSPAEEEYLISLAKKYNLFISGGSDFHGKNKPRTDLGTGHGNLLVPASLLEQFKRL